METTSKAKEAEGLEKRIVLQSPVLNPDSITLLQDQISHTIQIDRVPEEDLHLTLFHFGKPSELYGDLVAVNQGLDSDLFLEQFYKLLMTSSQIDMGTTEVTGEGLRLFEKDSNPIVALILSQQGEILDLRSEVLAKFREFLRSCGIVDFDGFMNSSPNLRYQSEDSYTPHISIGHTKSSNFPDLGVSGLELSLGKPGLRNGGLRN